MIQVTNDLIKFVIYFYWRHFIGDTRWEKKYFMPSNYAVCSIFSFLLLYSLCSDSRTCEEKEGKGKQDTLVETESAIYSMENVNSLLLFIVTKKLKQLF